MPQGFRHRADAVTENKAATLVDIFRTLPFKPFEFHGYLGNRRTVSFGLRYDYGKQAVEPAAAMPNFLAGLRDRVAGLAGIARDDFVQALVNEYAPGAGIGWHRDRPQFGVVAGVSL